jgi:hypothetical protein
MLDSCASHIYEVLEDVLKLVFRAVSSCCISRCIRGLQCQRHLEVNIEK